ncbi:MAG: hypothetical protein FD162_1320 [Rhodobacteraceae bacterium]|uniref:hypothetical protein n=1 Tax=Cypionkella sp. TaxID=2811411 RepID=UPI0013229FCB|nr:hypothetical protein [Cypionkella sp.]KAF0174085.1 MAG: hypothetical protein FD162_1320 [Paracoccaceae bacterium]MDO8326881.1 hypothetical protein [Cypionkella sp.]
MMANEMSSENIGFFDADEATQHAEVRQKWAAAERRRLRFDAHGGEVVPAPRRFYNLRHSLALFICPELRKERLKLSSSDYEKIKKSGVIDRMPNAGGPDFNLSYKAIKNICDGRAAIQAVGVCEPLHSIKEHLGAELITGQHDDGAGNPRLHQGVVGDIGGAVGVSRVDFTHGDSFQNDGVSNATAGTASCEGGAA